jgi:RNA polymerase sigma-70 factor (ECF subfamily)
MDYGQISTTDLARACCDTSNDAAWLEFYRRFNREMTAVVAAIAAAYHERSMQLYVEIVQEIYVRICRDDCRYLRLFKARSEREASTLIRDFAAKSARNYFRDTRRKKRSGGTQMSTEELESFEPVLLQKIEAKDVEQRILVQDLLKHLTWTLRLSRFASRDELIFRLRFKEGLTAKEIAAIPEVGLNAKAVEGSIRRSVARLRAVFETE